ncbi:ribonuclease P protein component [Brevibacillus fluminis]|uniref:Ribonuclease P protein component n=1 Tax=Brevibacillus fluminis TaxID=511487 RepID=A0A3M8D697_9BACL|nr:ribonuclease P protein component [Brevibacillus fluminis]RNB83438.1 ribonuclease P protein component [Brevibacillus fluminis]
MHHSHRLRKNEEFQAIFQKGKSAANKQFIVYSSLSDQTGYRIGISVSKKLGNAVVRNRVKRLIREACTRLEDKIQTGIDLIIIARPGTELMDFQSLCSSLQHAMKRAKVLNAQTLPKTHESNEKHDEKRG